MLVLVCLIFSVLSTIDTYSNFANETLFWMELITTLYIGFLGLIFSSYFVYLAEKDAVEEEGGKNTGSFSSYADALWWGVITVTTIGYGDTVPRTWMGKIVASCFSVFAISFFALPAGILGSGFALKVQQKQRQKHFNRQIPAAAMLIQCLWRCFAADKCFNSRATWQVYLTDSNGGPLVSTNATSGSGRDYSMPLSKSLILQVAKKASVLKRKKSKNRMEVNTSGARTEVNTPGPGTPLADTPTGAQAIGGQSGKALSDTDVMFYMEEPKSGTPNRTRRGERESIRGAYFTSQTSTVTEAASDDIDDLDGELPRVTQLTEAHKNAIRAIRKIKYFVARRKFQQARKPYDVRDVIEQYSQGHLNMMVRIKELQRRLDQTLGKPGSYLAGIDRVGNVKPMTVGARLYRVEQQLGTMDKKLDAITNVMNVLAQQHQQQQQIGIRPIEDSA
ncbi:unnamed protein product [Phaedon cochleariae]|uniref:Potassium voltage-gated channel subfamily KQT member 1 n=1 Tax=Phaedon cochleariae TaxID=80249 RepID=A0A9P0DT67_PHACE|nr:unnamed protein product [Phaedon cochleariae]